VDVEGVDVEAGASDFVALSDFAVSVFFSDEPPPSPDDSDFPFCA